MPISSGVLRYLRDGTTADGEFDELGDIGDIEPVLGYGGTVDGDLQLRGGGLLVDSHVGGALDVRHHGGYLLRHTAALVDVVGVDLQCQVAVGAGNLVHDHVDDGLGETCRVAGHLLDGCRHGLDQLRLGASALPGVVGFQAYAHLHVRQGEAFGAFVVAA